MIDLGRRRRWVTAVAGVIAVGLLTSACGGGPSPQPDSTPGTLPSRPSNSVAAGPTQAFATAATLAIGLAGEPRNWNPLAAPSRTDPALATVVAAVWPDAFVADSGLTVDRNDLLVTSASETDAVAGSSGTTGTLQTVVYEINARATWSDGVPITGADFVYTWETQSGRSRFRDTAGRPFTPGSTAGYRQIASVATDRHDADRVTVRFATPDPDWQSLFDPILPAHVGRAVGFDHGFRDPVTSLVSGGPFLVQAYQPGADVVLVRNPRWWGPAANLSALDITFVDSATEAAANLETGQLGAAVSAFTPATVAALSATDGLTVSVTNGASFDDLVFDERAGPLAVRAVRLAVMLAVNRRALSRQAVASGDTAAAPVTNRALPPGSTGYRDETAILGGVATPDPARAQQLLAAAGYVRSGATLTRRGHAVRLTLVVDSSSPLAGAEVAAIVGACRSIGIAVVTTATSPAPAGRIGVGHRASMDLVEAPLTALPAQLASAYGTQAAGNLSGYASPVMDGLLARLAAAGPTAEGDEVADQVDAQAWSDAVDLPLLGVPTVLAYQSRYTNLQAASGVSEDVARWGITQ